MNRDGAQNRSPAGGSIPPPLPSIFDLIRRQYDLQVAADAPGWAKLAAKMAFDSLTPMRRKSRVSDAYEIGFDSGYWQGATELLESKSTARPAQEAASSPAGEGCSMILKRHWAGQPSDKAADFFCGFRDGERLMGSVPERARQMAQRTKIYRAIAAQWRQIAPGVLHDTGQLHQWLLAHRIISLRTDSAETRLVCAKIGLRYKRPGKPRKR